MGRKTVARQGKESWVGLVRDLDDTLRSLAGLIVRDLESSPGELEWDNFDCFTGFCTYSGMNSGSGISFNFQIEADIDVPLQLARELHGNAKVLRLRIEDLSKQIGPDAEAALLRKDIESAIGWLGYMLMWLDARTMVDKSR